MNLRTLAALAGFVAVSCSCTMRSTTTARTAIEQALLSQASERSIALMDFKSLAGKSFVIKEDKWDAVDGKFVLAQLREQLLASGLTAADKEESATLLVYPRSGAHGIDDSEFLLGLPAIPVPIPTVGTLQTPELALFAIKRQRGRDRMGVEVEERKTGVLAKQTDMIATQTRYDRYTILIFFGFHTTDLGKPF